MRTSARPSRIVDWNRRFERHGALSPGAARPDIDRARAAGRTAVFFGLQNASAIEDDIGLVEILHTLGIRFMQLTYNNQSLLGSGCYEAEDTGITRMGREVIAEMNRVGMAIDMSHSGERSTREAIDLSARPIAITHANPSSWHEVPRNKSDAAAEGAGGTRRGARPVALPAPPAGAAQLHARGITTMVARLADLIGVDHIGIGSDLCQDQPDSVVAWMRNGRWTKSEPSIGLGAAVFPPQPSWFRDNRDFAKHPRRPAGPVSRPAMPPRSWAGTGIGSTLTASAARDRLSQTLLRRSQEQHEHSQRDRRLHGHEGRRLLLQGNDRRAGRHQRGGPAYHGGGRPHPAQRLAAAPFAAPTSVAPTAAPPSRCGGACSPTSAPASRHGRSRSFTPICRATISASSSA